MGATAEIMPPAPQRLLFQRSIALRVHGLQTWTLLFPRPSLPAERIFVKPNFVFPDPRPQGCASNGSRGEYALFVGRLSPEKGLCTLLAAWKLMKGQIPLRIVGDGPLRKELEAASGKREGISLDGRVSREGVFEAFRRARFLVFPSEWYETFGCVVGESFAFGVPVIASRLGAVRQIVEHNVSGLLFTPGDAGDLVATVQWAWAHPREMKAMGQSARREYEAKYSAERNYKLLMEIYDHVLAGGTRHPAHASQAACEPGTSYVKTGARRI